MPRRPQLASFLTAVSLALAPAAWAQEAGAPPEGETPALGLELNGAAGEGEACRLTFVVRNGLGAALDGLVYEMVLFTGSGQVAAMTLFDFGGVPADTPRVRQFDVAGTACADLSQVLVNGAETCEAEGLEPGACVEGLEASSRIDTIELAG